MPARTAQAVWEGDLKSGKGTMRLGGGAFEGAYSFLSRFEDGKGTNPEELIAAAHAGCFSMAFSNGLSQAGFPPKRVQTTANVHLEKGAAGFEIPPHRPGDRSQRAGHQRRPVSRAGRKSQSQLPRLQALAAAKISLNAKLVH